MNQEDLILSFENAQQGHVFRFLDQLSPDQAQALCDQAGQIDLAELAHLGETLVKSQHGSEISPDSLAPSPVTPLPENGGDPEQWKAATEAGETALRAGRAAAFTVAGGQGTRLGYDGPKGTFEVSPVRNASLFQIFAEKIHASEKRYDTTIPWFIMTSIINHEATEQFFEENQYFGLSPENVTFFRQGLMPAVDYDGKILLSDKSTIAMSPDGHGGSLRALVRSGATAEMEKRGIDIISYFQVDNPLVRCIDPAFIGFHLLSESEMSSKAIPKASAEEKVGVFCIQDGTQAVVEYSDLPESLMHATTETGELVYNAGSIAIHILSREFVERAGGNQSDASLPFHRADKKIPTISPDGTPLSPDSPNGIKFELFVFDAIPLAANPIVIETSRADDFSPVKNAEGNDSPTTCRNDQLRQWGRWLSGEGIEIETDSTGLPAFNFEITPLFADTAEAFSSAMSTTDSKPEIGAGLVL